VEDVVVATKKFEHSIEWFEGTHEENNNQEVMGCLIPAFQESPMDQKEAKADQNEPFEEFDPGGKGYKGNWELRILN
jgi:hypothetical protein